MERRREFAAAYLQAESYLEREHNARWAALGVAHATSGITANVLTLPLPRCILARDQLNPCMQGAQGKDVEQRRGIWSKSIAHSSADRIPHSEFSLRTLIGTAFPQRNEVRAHLCLGSTQIAQWIVRAAAALAFQCTRALLHRYSCLLHQYSCLCPHCDLQNQSGRHRPLVPIGMAYGLREQINSIASAETTVLKTGFGPGGAGDLLSPSIAFARTSTGRVAASASAYGYADTI